MPYEITYHDDPCGVITKFFGIISDKDVLQSGFDRIQSAEIFEKLVYAIDDYSEVEDFSVSAEGVREISTFTLEISIANKNIKFLAIMPNDQIFSQGLLWKLLSQETGWKIDIVHTKEEAEDWIKNNAT